MADFLPPAPPIAPGGALLLDFDGTLVELAERPDAIRVPPPLPGLLGRLAERLEGRLAIVSGRSIEDLERHTGTLPFALSGSHGAELRLAGAAPSFLDRPQGFEAARTEAARFAMERPGLLIEDKPAGFAIHYRGVPNLREPVEEVVARLAARTGMKVQHGKMVAELLPAGAGKGEAVRRIMLEPPFAGARPLFVGDDLTDEHAFEAAAELGGGGILVGAPRPTSARWRLEDVASVARWLEAAAG